MLRRIKIWREVPGYPGYYASLEGDILGLRGRILKPSWMGGPVHYRLGITAYVNHKAYNVHIHRMVLLAYRGPPPTPEHEGAHINGNPADNWLRNLRWATPRQNQLDRFRHGTSVALFDEEQIREIRWRCRMGERQADIARDYNVKQTTIRAIHQRKSYAYVEELLDAL
jgi:HNH endonuclease